MATYIHLIVATILLSNVVISLPVSDLTTEALVISTTTDEAIESETTTIKKVENAVTHPPELKSMHVISNVSNRYAHTVVSSRYKNPENKAQEATFSIVLPDTAFISGFVMEIKGKTYEAYVREKEEAKREYNEAVQSGLAAAHVELNARDSNRFTVSVNVEPHSKVTFNLSYEELLVRKHGKYEMVVNLHPGQLVKDLTVDVNIIETKRLVNVNTPALRSGNEIIEDNSTATNEYATINKVGEDGKAVQIHFAPSVQQQKEMAKKLLAANKEEEMPGRKSPNGLSGQFVVEYDVQRDKQGGEVLVNDGYFVHFFAPSELKSLSKHAVFVLDVSGSMGGRKIEQLKQAMLIILDQLNPSDYFNLVEFSFGAKVWNLDNLIASPTFSSPSTYGWWRQPEEGVTPEPKELPPAFPVTPENIQKAKEIIGNMQAGGGTNIYDSLKVGLNLTSNGVPEKEGKQSPQPIVVFLTDGDATDGETDPKVILKKVDELNNGGDAAVFSLSFGYDANRDFLKKLSLQNSGFMRQIYEAADASLQLQDFYKQISSPLLTNVTFKYPEEQVNSLTKHKFHTLFNGAELVVAGKMENPKDQILYVHGLTHDGPIDFPPVIVDIPIDSDIKQEVGPLERLWAYLTIKQLLDKKDALADTDSNSTESETLKKQALQLALKYSFVTPVSSLVVVKPNETEKVSTEEAQATNDYGYPTSAYFSAPLIVGGAGPAYSPGAGFGGGFSGISYNLPTLSLPAAPSPLGFPALGSPDSLMHSFDKLGVQEELISEFNGPYLSTTFRPRSTTFRPQTTSVNLPEPNMFDNLKWLTPLFVDANFIAIDNVKYAIGNNQTVVDEQECKVESLELSGNCTLLSQCPKIHTKLDSLDTYRQYFCELGLNKYAGVCCVDSTEDEE